MQSTLEDYLLISQKSRFDLADDLKMHERSVRNWLKEGGYKVAFDGRSFKVHSITSKRRVWERTDGQSRN